MSNQTLRASLFASVGFGLIGNIAHAQSSVTLYGVVDSGMVYTNNQKGGSAIQAESGEEQGTRWGLIGSEDLGGGTKTIFKLENGYNIESGTLLQGGRIFGRNAYVGITNPHFGTLTMGRQYNASQDVLEPLQLAGTSALSQFATHPFDTDDIDNTFRSNNTVKYATPIYAGWQGSGMYGFSNQSGFTQDRTYSLGLRYAKGPLQMGAAYVRLDNPTVDTGGAITTDNYYRFLTDIAHQQIMGVGGLYTLGNSTFGLLYTTTLFQLKTPGDSQRYTNYDASYRYAITPALRFAIGETYTLVHIAPSATNAGRHYLQTTTGLQYFLSKATDVYVNFAYQKASGNTVAEIQGAPNPSSTNSQFISLVGLRHRF